jgi:glucose/arabinose dehydrogenase
MLMELGQRIRDVRQGPDGLLYLLTDEDAAALLKIEPVAPAQTAAPARTAAQ